MMRLLRATLLVAFVALLAPIESTSPPAEAQEGGCVRVGDTVDCSIGTTIPGGTQPGQDSDDEDTTGGGSGPAIPMSPDVTAGGMLLDCSSARGLSGSEASWGWEQLDTSRTSGNLSTCAEGQGVNEDDTIVDYAPEGTDPAPAPPSPEEVAAGLLLEAHARMRAPQVVADPPVGTPSIITLPVFVQVTNWVDGFDVGDCVGPVCVTLTAEPTLTFDPGEPGSESIVCEPPGTRFDPNGPDPEVQAGAPGACAYAYRARTGADERPEAWPGQVTVTWDVSWTAGGASGEFDPQALSTDLPREVDEVQTLVRDGAS